MIENKRPPIVETVGAQHYCFATKEEGSTEFTGEYEEKVIRTATVKSVKVSENGESTPIYASGDVYDTVDDVATHDIEVEVIAFDPTDLDRMRGETVTESGLVLTGNSPERTFFAYGKIVKLRGGNVRYEWYPRCKLIENSNEVSTREEKFSEQPESVTIRAFPFDGVHIKTKYESASKRLDWMTEDLFFSKPILTEADLLSLNPTEQGA